MKTLKPLLILLPLLLFQLDIDAFPRQTQKKSFIIYGFIPYSSYKITANIITKKPPQAYFDTLGIRPIYLIYEKRILDYPQGNTSTGVINQEKLRELATEAGKTPEIPVSLDLEGWDAYGPETPSRFCKAVLAFKRLSPKSAVGVYATVPQNSYDWSKIKKVKWQEWNKNYAKVAKVVDYYSPSLYNYSGHDFESWKQGASENIKAARAYNPKKKIFVYITPEITKGRVTTWLSEEEMRQRLQTLVTLGADGCIIWGSSKSKSESNQRPILDASTGWLKAVAEF